METMFGKVAAREEQNGRVKLTVINKGGKAFLSFFLADQYMSPEITEKLNAIKVNDEGEFKYLVRGQYKNVKDFMPHIQTSAEPEEGSSPHTGVSAGKELGKMPVPADKKSSRMDFDVDKMVGTCTSYAMELEKICMTAMDPASEGYGVPDFERISEHTEKFCRVEMDLIKKFRGE